MSVVYCSSQERMRDEKKRVVMKKEEKRLG